jgi:hypothetical protein
MMLLTLLFSAAVPGGQGGQRGGQVRGRAGNAWFLPCPVAACTLVAGLPLLDDAAGAAAVVPCCAARHRDHGV